MSSKYRFYFKHGFRITIAYNVLFNVCRNHLSALDNKSHVTAKIVHEVELNIIIGLFDTLQSNLFRTTSVFAFLTTNSTI